MPIFPLLFVPVFSDALHSIIIRSVINKEQIQKTKVLYAATLLFFPLLTMKLLFWFKAVLWGFLPVIGFIKDFRYRMYWEMASNVAVFEGLFGKEGRKRCVSLIDRDSSGIGAKTFVTTPGILVMFCFLCFVVFSDIFKSSLVFWIAILLIYWISVPVSATVNTLYYLHLVEFEPKIESEIVSSAMETGI